MFIRNKDTEPQGDMFIEEEVYIDGHFVDPEKEGDEDAPDN